MRRGLLLLVSGCVVAALAAASGRADTPPATIPAGVTIEGVAVGGLAPDAAAAAVDSAFDQPLKLVYARTTILAAPSVLGASPQTDKAVQQALSASENADVPLSVTIQTDETAAFVSRLAGRFDRPARDAQLFLRHLRPWLSVAKAGRKLNQRAAVKAIVSTLLAGERGPLALTGKVLQPTVTRANFGPVIVIRRSSNRLHLYRGMRFQRRFVVATGQKRYPTPLGRFRIVVKWRNPWWYPPKSPWAEGQKPIPPGPNNPLGTRWMGLSAPGVGIHGTPDDASIGYSASHGCIRMHIPDAEWLFVHVHVGTPVFII
jgi:lipoprotein-anchoring transpeptidase ErfK/SrfK